MIPVNNYLWVKPIEEESTFKVEEENYCFVEVIACPLAQGYFEKGTKLIVKHLELYMIKNEKYYFVTQDNVVARFDD